MQEEIVQDSRPEKIRRREGEGEADPMVQRLRQPPRQKYEGEADADGASGLESVEWEGGSDILYLGAAFALVITAITFFLGWRAKKE